MFPHEETPHVIHGPRSVLPSSEVSPPKGDTENYSRVPISPGFPLLWVPPFDEGAEHVGFQKTSSAHQISGRFPSRGVSIPWILYSLVQSRPFHLLFFQCWSRKVVTYTPLSKADLFTFCSSNVGPKRWSPCILPCPKPTFSPFVLPMLVPKGGHLLYSLVQSRPFHLLLFRCWSRKVVTFYTPLSKADLFTFCSSNVGPETWSPSILPCPKPTFLPFVLPMLVPKGGHLPYSLVQSRPFHLLFFQCWSRKVVTFHTPLSKADLFTFCSSKVGPKRWSPSILSCLSPFVLPMLVPKGGHLLCALSKAGLFHLLFFQCWSRKVVTFYTPLSKADRFTFCSFKGGHLLYSLVQSRPFHLLFFQCWSRKVVTFHTPLSKADLFNSCSCNVAPERWSPSILPCPKSIVSPFVLPVLVPKGGHLLYSLVQSRPFHLLFFQCWSRKVVTFYTPLSKADLFTFCSSNVGPERWSPSILPCPKPAFFTFCSSHVGPERWSPSILPCPKPTFAPFVLPMLVPKGGHLPYSCPKPTFSPFVLPMLVPKGGHLPYSLVQSRPFQLLFLQCCSRKVVTFYTPLSKVDRFTFCSSSVGPERWSPSILPCPKPTFSPFVLPMLVPKGGHLLYSLVQSRPFHLLFFQCWSRKVVTFHTPLSKADLFTFCSSKVGPERWSPSILPCPKPTFSTFVLPMLVPKGGHLLYSLVQSRPFHLLFFQCWSRKVVTFHTPLSKSDLFTFCSSNVGPERWSPSILPCPKPTFSPFVLPMLVPKGGHLLYSLVQSRPFHLLFFQCWSRKVVTFYTPLSKADLFTFCSSNVGPERWSPSTLRCPKSIVLPFVLPVLVPKGGHLLHSLVQSRPFHLLFFQCGSRKVDTFYTPLSKADRFTFCSSSVGPERWSPSTLHCPKPTFSLFVLPMLVPKGGHLPYSLVQSRPFHLLFFQRWSPPILPCPKPTFSPFVLPMLVPKGGHLPYSCPKPTFSPFVLPMLVPKGGHLLHSLVHCRPFHLLFFQCWSRKVVTFYTPFSKAHFCPFVLPVLVCPLVKAPKGGYLLFSGPGQVSLCFFACSLKPTSGLGPWARGRLCARLATTAGLEFLFPGPRTTQRFPASRPLQESCFLWFRVGLAVEFLSLAH